MAFNIIISLYIHSSYRGAGEMARVILKISNVEFNDIRFSVKTINGKYTYSDHFYTLISALMN